MDTLLKQGATMPRSIPVPVRQSIQKRSERGQDVSTIAEALHLRPRTVRHILQRLREEGAEAMKPRYDRCGREALEAPSAIIQDAILLRQQHPSWGAGLIRVILGKQHPDTLVPCARTLQRWLGRSGQEPAAAGRRPAKESCRAKVPHEVWQMDAADQVFLKTRQQISWLRLSDECSGAVLETVVFSPGVLEPSPRVCRARPLAPGLFTLGASAAPACGQRHAVGVIE
jgi:hypothetical protein